MDFDWVMHIGFSYEEARIDYFRNLKGELRDYWYQQCYKKKWGNAINMMQLNLQLLESSGFCYRSKKFRNPILQTVY